MLGDLSAKTAFITGGGSGIGRGIAGVMALQGARVVVADVDVEGADGVAREIVGQGGEAIALQVDVASQEQVDVALEEAARSFSNVDILVNNAGVSGSRANNDEDWRQIFDINVMGVVHCCVSVVPQMQERRYGKIVNIASMAGHAGRGSVSSYAAGKAAVLRYTKGLAHELGQFSINVNAICPGAVWTPFQERSSQRAIERDPGVSGMDPYDLFLKRYEDVIPMGRPQSPEDIGKAAAFLASDDAGNITGQCLHVDGGAVLRD
jgi:NAD(P)-dependent dehydrogenase (short-subunit alcohol dehydrogenase family)